MSARHKGMQAVGGAALQECNEFKPGSTIMYSELALWRCEVFMRCKSRVLDGYTIRGRALGHVDVLGVSACNLIVSTSGRADTVRTPRSGKGSYRAHAMEGVG